MMKGFAMGTEKKMLPIGPLMIEHRLIGRMIGALRKETDRMERERTVDGGFLETAIDFIRTYADRLHHGKEEDILFSKLAGKDLAEEHRAVLEELKAEHVAARKATENLAEAAAHYQSGKKEAFAAIVKQAKFLVEAYPRHIDKEEKQCFLPCMKYLSREEKDELLERGYEFDRNLIHEIYNEKVMREEKKAEAA